MMMLSSEVSNKHDECRVSMFSEKAGSFFLS